MRNSASRSESAGIPQPKPEPAITSPTNLETVELDPLPSAAELPRKIGYAALFNVDPTFPSSHRTISHVHFDAMSDEGGRTLAERVSAAGNTVQTVLFGGISPEKAALATEALDFLEKHSFAEFLNRDRSLAFPIAKTHTAIAESALRSSHFELAQLSLNRATVAMDKWENEDLREVLNLYQLVGTLRGYVQLRVLSETIPNTPGPEHLMALATIVKKVSGYKPDRKAASTQDLAQILHSQYYLMGCANMLGDTDAVKHYARDANEWLMGRNGESLAAQLPNTMTLRFSELASEHNVYGVEFAQKRAANLRNILPRKTLEIVQQQASQEADARLAITRLRALANGDGDKYRLSDARY